MTQLISSRSKCSLRVSWSWCCTSPSLIIDLGSIALCWLCISGTTCRSPLLFTFYRFCCKVALGAHRYGSSAVSFRRWLLHGLNWSVFLLLSWGLLGIIPSDFRIFQVFICKPRAYFRIFMTLSLYFLLCFEVSCWFVPLYSLIFRFHCFCIVLEHKVSCSLSSCCFSPFPKCF